MLSGVLIRLPGCVISVLRNRVVSMLNEVETTGQSSSIWALVQPEVNGHRVSVGDRVPLPGRMIWHRENPDFRPGDIATFDSVL